MIREPTSSDAEGSPHEPDTAVNAEISSDNGDIIIEQRRIRSRRRLLLASIILLSAAVGAVGVVSITTLVQVIRFEKFDDLPIESGSLYSVFIALLGISAAAIGFLGATLLKFQRVISRKQVYVSFKKEGTTYVLNLDNPDISEELAKIVKKDGPNA
jgi:hypothetical protein